MQKFQKIQQKNNQILAQKCVFFIERKEMKLINYFFEIVVPQLLEYFKDNAKDVPYSLLSEVLINNKNYEEEVKEMIEKSKEVSKKYEENK